MVDESTVLVTGCGADLEPLRESIAAPSLPAVRVRQLPNRSRATRSTEPMRRRAFKGSAP